MNSALRTIHGWKPGAGGPIFGEFHTIFGATPCRDNFATISLFSPAIRGPNHSENLLGLMIFHCQSTINLIMLMLFRNKVSLSSG